MVKSTDLSTVYNDSPKRVEGSFQLDASSDTTKAQILGDIRSALKQFTESDRAEIASRFDEINSSQSPRPVVDGILLDRFIEKHTAVKGTYKVVSNHSELPGAVKEFLDGHDLPAEMLMGNTEFLLAIDWPDDWTIDRRTACKTDTVSVTDAICAIAETGTIVAASTPEVSSTHMFVPENHVVIMDVGQLVRHLEDALQLVSVQITGHSRGIHMITGPSKTADVEQTIQYGAHGPRRLHVIFVDSGA